MRRCEVRKCARGIGLPIAGEVPRRANLRRRCKCSKFVPGGLRGNLESIVAWHFHSPTRAMALKVIVVWRNGVICVLLHVPLSLLSGCMADLRSRISSVLF
jgi:hypothetical protein